MGWTASLFGKVWAPTVNGWFSMLVFELNGNDFVMVFSPFLVAVFVCIDRDYHHGKVFTI